MGTDDARDAAVRGPTPGHGPGHDHAHGHGGGVELRSSPVRLLLWGVLGAVAVATLVGVGLLWPARARVGGAGDDPTAPSSDVALVKARVSAVRATDCAGATRGGPVTCRTVDAVLTSGTERGQTARFQMVDSDVGARVEVGDRVVLSDAPTAPPAQRYQFSDFERDRPLALLAALFAVAVIALARWKGLRALLAVVASIGVLAAFALPSLLDGRNPLVVALVAASLMAFGALYLTHGFNDATTVALLGTLASLALTAVLGWMFVGLTRLTGFADEEAVYLRAASGEIDVRGLLLAGIVIGSLGVLDDVTVTQVSAVDQIRRADPTLAWRQLHLRGLAVGRDHVASAVNTLVLAYAGTSLPLLLLFTQTERPIRDVLTGEVVAAEIVRTLVGSIGLVASVPLTTWLAAVTLSVPAAGAAARTGAGRSTEPGPTAPGPDDR